MSAPTAKTIRNVVTHLKELGLQIYGQHTTFDEQGTAYLSAGCGDFDAEDIIKWRKALRAKRVVDLREVD